ncbi:DNA internalization-related competence protein ComEC/Rec2 [Lactobacillus sp. PV037]|uniref:DNA internalization-related competence protein ComEC/Rec2 n=1 Tax=unclassified Lactobacillus TaxID=2620435 RepID=UPI00223EFDE3|nr:MULTISPECIES: DNA internalization-related competence protein ComEC/Rec2 [unclassified Lactobacillus]QNQ82432.1 DNA internalization-related competence protein ComEC/Rec2 [Lactobacillus sp. PV012]QNQ83455.1 DNA internalization-related competence protein ComEC/Rec2 [Lactobacillus sp. PV037]
MKSSKINWNYEFLRPGYLLLISITCIIISLIVFQAHTWGQFVVSGILLLYLGGLIKYKYRVAKGWIIILGCVFLCLINKNNFDNQGIGNRLFIYPDEVSITDHYLSGQISDGKNTFLVGMKTASGLEEAIKQGLPLVLSEVNLEKEEIDQETNFGQFDFRKYYQTKKIKYRLKVVSTNFSINNGKNLQIFFHKIRYELQRYFDQMPKLTKFFASEMILAKNPSADNKSILSNYRNLGVIHLLSISGLHVSLYVAAISLGLTKLKRSPDEIFIFCSIFLGFEIIISNWQAGFVRASLGYIYGKIVEKHHLPIARGDRLGAVVLTHLLLNPTLFLSSGAILSYLLVGGLELLESNSIKFQGIKLNLLITPILLYYFYQVNILTPFFNLLIVPIFNFVLLPLTVIGIFSFWQLPNITLYFIEPVFQKINIFIDGLASTRIGQVLFGKINWWQLLLLLIITIVFILTKEKTKKSRLCFGTVIMTYVLIFVSIHFPLVGQVSIIDVGQGDSILITTPLKRKVYLIDTGGKVTFGKKKITQAQLERITLPFLQAQGINKIDGVFLSHQDADHIGDLRTLLQNIKVSNLYFAKGLTNNPSFQKRISNCVNYTKLTPLLAGDTVKDQNIAFHVVYPFQEGLGKNEDSLSLFFTLAHKNWLMTGDLDQAGELKLIERYPLKVDYFKLGHHGSKTSSNPAFLKQICPSMVFISSGRNNRYGHPHLETLKTLNELKIAYLNTQDRGTITWKYNIFNQEHFETYLFRRKK